MDDSAATATIEDVPDMSTLPTMSELEDALPAFLETIAVKEESYVKQLEGAFDQQQEGLSVFACACLCLPVTGC